MNAKSYPHAGFLNAYFPDWYLGPPAARLPFAYNAQRTLYWMTHDKAPGYWEAVQPVKVRRMEGLHACMCMHKGRACGWQHRTCVL